MSTAFVPSCIGPVFSWRTSAQSWPGKLWSIVGPIGVVCAWSVHQDLATSPQWPAVRKQYVVPLTENTTRAPTVEIGRAHV